MSAISTIQELENALISLSHEYEGFFELIVFNSEADYELGVQPWEENEKTLAIVATIDGHIFTKTYYYYPDDDNSNLFDPIEDYTITLQDAFDKIYCELAYGS